MRTTLNKWFLLAATLTEQPLAKIGPGCGSIAPGSQEMIPIRGTILSASFFIPYIVLFLLFKTIQVDQVTRVYAIKLLISVILIIRCPVTALTTYKRSSIGTWSLLSYSSSNRVYTLDS